MPRKKSISNNSQQTGGNSMPEFVRCELSDEQKGFIKSNLPSIVELVGQLEDLLADHYKLTISFDESTDCYAAYLIGKEGQAVNGGLMLSAFAPVFTGALAVLMYKHFTVLKEDWPSRSQSNNPASWR